MSLIPLFNPQAEKFIKKLDPATKERIRKRIIKLQEDPFPQDIERVEGYKGEKVFRVRVGDYRILYVVRYLANELLVAKVEGRDKVYH